MQPSESTQATSEGMQEVLEVFGPVVEFLTPPSQPGAVYCVMRGTIPAGVTVPMHSHADDESFYVVSGTALALIERDDRLEWMDVKAGDFFHIPGGAKHAHRNNSRGPVVELLISTPRIGHFFQEVGRSVTPGAPLPPPTPEQLQHFARVAARYNHWLASPEENAAVGIVMP